MGVALDLTAPYLLGQAIDRFLIPRKLDGLKRIGGLMLATYAGSCLLNLGQSRLMTALAQRVVQALRSDLFTRLQLLPLRFFDRRSHGDLMSRLTNDLDSLGQVLGASVTQLIAGCLCMTGVVVIMLRLSPLLGLACVGTSAFIILGVNRWIAGRIRKAFRLQQAALGKLNGFVEEVMGGQRVIKAYHHENETIAEFASANRELLRDSKLAQIFGGLPGPMAYFSGDLGQVVVAFVGGVLVLRGMATVGAVAAFMVYTRLFSRPLNELANLYNQILSALAGTERVFEIVDEEPDADASGDTIEIAGEVRFENVCFSYEEGRPVINQVDFQVPRGKTLALIGATGSGKTTIVNLLTRFYDADSGRISVDGRDIRLIPKPVLRRQLGVVLQDTFLFSGSVRDNIRYGRPDASDDEIVHAAQLANAHHFIHRLPEGYATVLSEGGADLSQGQRQLIAIARTVLADPRVLILDEATSSIDTRTEVAIQEAMSRLMAGRTCIVIAHRLRTIRNADEVLILKDGRIIRRGTHRELFASGGRFETPEF
jgi:ATP-binding cassette subfamily B protein